jgi:hypothetical protein
MSRLLAVAARELRERWLLFPASLVFGLNPLVLPAFGVDKRAMPFVGVVTALGLSAAAALIMGSTMLARDTANGRLGFLFTRPLSWPTIWGGKWLAAIVLVASSGVLAAIPFMVAYPSESHGGSWVRTMASEHGWVVGFGVVLLGAAAANFAATAWRSRSPWVALDMGLLMAVLWFARRHVAPLWLYGIMGKDERSLLLAVAPLVVGLFAGSAAQVAVGRTDVRRAHRALSLVLWTVIVVAVAAAGGYWRWVLSAAPADVSVRSVAQDPAGRWIYFEGEAPRGGWYPYGYLVDSVDGRWAARPNPVTSDGNWHVPVGARFSADGRFFAELRVEGRGAGVVLVDLASRPPRLAHVSLEASPPPDWSSQFALSPTGDSVFVAHESGASIFGLPSGRRLATTTIAPGWRPVAARYVGTGSTRTWLVPWNRGAHVPASRAELLVVGLEADGRAKTTALPLQSELAVPAAWKAVRTSADGSRIVTFDGGAHLRDGASGAMLATLSESKPDEAVSFLADGRVVVAEALPSDGEAGRPGAIVRVFDRDGVKLGESPLDLPAFALSLEAEVAPGKVLVSSRRRFIQTDTVVFDVAAGRIVQRLSGLSPVPPFWFGPGAGAPGAVSGNVQFLTDGSGNVRRYDFATGISTTVAGPGAPRGEQIRIDW